MGLSPFKSCTTNYAARAPAPNPDPKRWKILNVWIYPNGYVLLVRYLDAINFEGVKVMVYRGKYRARRRSLDPHFTPRDNSPIARFRPDAEGIAWAKQLASRLE